VPNRFVSTWVYALPALAGRPAYLRYVAGGWQVSGILTLRSGQPFSVVSGVDNSLSSNGGDRADLIGNPFLDTSRLRGQLIAKYLNTAAFARNAVGTFGTAPRDLMTGPGLAGLDVAGMKIFKLSERFRLEFRAEFFNALNRPNLSNPNGTVSSSNFGKITSAGDPRIGQFALKLAF
jgi:hypothetical protein